MEIEETAQTADVKTDEHVLSDLPVNDEEANETNGGGSTLSTGAALHLKPLVADQA